jgi:hypothetical protein
MNLITEIHRDWAGVFRSSSGDDGVTLTNFVGSWGVFSIFSGDAMGFFASIF